MVNSSAGFHAGDAGTYVYDTTPPDSASLSPQVTYCDGVFTFTGTVSTALGVMGVGIDAIVDGVPTNFGATTVDASGNFTSADRLGPHTQGFITAVTLDQGNGNYSSATDIAPSSLTGGLFRADGIDHDTLSFKGSDFGADPASRLASVLANTHFENGGAVITDPATQETVKLSGVSKQQLVANQQDFTFHA